MAVYIVKPKDTFYGIAKEVGITPSALLILNPQIDNTAIIFPGQSVNVPDPASSPDQSSSTPTGDASQGTDPPWLAIARLEIGVREYPRGEGDNPRIIEYHQATSLKARSQQTSWCSSFMNWVMEQAGYQGTRSAAAKSWLNWKGGRRLDLSQENPQVGDIVIFHRGSGWQGHVGFYVGENKKRIYVLGGNQGDQVCVATYPRSKLAGIVRPKGENQWSKNG